MNYIDTHTHFDLCIKEGIDENSLIQGMRESGIVGAVQVSIDVEGFSWSRDFAVRNASHGVLFTLGIHPSSLAGEKELSLLDNFSRNVMSSADAGLLFGIGETGLDYYRMRQAKEVQQRSFESQILLAKELDLPIIVHSRDAAVETLALLVRHAPLKGIMHCFSEGREMAKKFLDLGFMLSFAGNVTYAKALLLHESASYAPLDRLLLETDAPFLAPVPLRGKKNRPDHVPHTYRFVSTMRGIKTEDMAVAIHENYRTLLNRDASKKNQRDGLKA